MYRVTKVSTIIDDDIYDIKIPLSKKNLLIEKYNLLSKSEIKEYWINNLHITSDINGLNYNYIVDESIDFDKENNLLIEKYNIVNCVPFNFFECDLEDKYLLYFNENNRIEMKEYDDYITLEITGKDLIEIKNNII